MALMGDDLRKFPFAVRLGRRTLRIIRFNVVFSLATKAVFLVLATMGLATLWMGVAADMGATLLVIGNGMRLLRGSNGSGSRIHKAIEEGSDGHDESNTPRTDPGCGWPL